jgi:hypothetical protein
MPWPGNAMWASEWARKNAAEHPDLVVTPWGQEWRRTASGLYQPGVRGVRPLSLGALLDVMARWRSRSYDAFTQTPRGRLYAIAGDRLVFLWRDPRTDTWSAGHLSADGPRDGHWLVQGRGMWLALDLALAYCRDHASELPVQLDHEKVCVRLDTRE